MDGRSAAGSTGWTRLVEKYVFHPCFSQSFAQEWWLRSKWRVPLRPVSWCGQALHWCTERLSPASGPVVAAGDDVVFFFFFAVTFCGDGLRPVDRTRFPLEDEDATDAACEQDDWLRGT